MSDINLTIGSDPEFVIMCGDSVENAIEIFHKLSMDMDCQYRDLGIGEDDIEAAYVQDESTYISAAMASRDIQELLDMYPFLLGNISDKTESISKCIDVILKHYDSVGYPDLSELPEDIYESIRIEILDDLESMYEDDAPDRDYFCTTEIGCDGQTALGELRPKFGNNPIEHFNEILKLMKEMNDLLEPEIICYGEELQIKAGAYQGDRSFEVFQLAGHIHLGFEKTVMLNTIGRYLSFFCGIPLTLITDTEKMFYGHTSERDMRHKEEQYGEYGGYREKPYGIEFRMPSSWLVSPQITIGALSLAYVIGYEFLTKEMAAHDVWFERFKETHGIHPDKYIEWYVHQNWILLQGEFKPIKLEIQQMKLYPKYKEYIDYILNMIDKKETWHSERDIMPLWAELW